MKMSHVRAAYQAADHDAAYDVTEKSVQQLHAALASGRVTARQLMQDYIDRRTKKRD